MNRLFLLAIPAIVALTGCGNDDQPRIDDAGKPVNFSASISGAAPSRAYDTSWDTNDGIGISGTTGGKTYTNVAYAHRGNGTFTAHTPGTEIYYQSDAAVTFTAYYPWNNLSSGSGTSISADTKQQGGQKTFDFLWSQASGSKASPNVNFVFTHKMAKIVLTVKKGPDVSFDEVKDAGLYLAGFKNNGSFDVVNGSATASGDAVSETTPWNFANNESAAVENAPQSTNDVDETVAYTMILFPQEFTAPLPITARLNSNSLTLSTALDFTTANGSTGDQQAKNELVAGRQYNISLTLNKTKLTAEGCTITEWNEADGGNFDAI